MANSSDSSANGFMKPWTHVIATGLVLCQNVSDTIRYPRGNPMWPWNIHYKWRFQWKITKQMGGSNKPSWLPLTPNDHHESPLALLTTINHYQTLLTTTNHGNCTWITICVTFEAWTINPYDDCSCSGPMSMAGRHLTRSIPGSS